MLDIVTGVGMPHGKGLLRRGFEQIVGKLEKWNGHQEQIQNIHNKLDRLLDKWTNDNCGDPPGFVSRTKELTMDEKLRELRRRQERLNSPREIVAPIAVGAGAYAVYRLLRLVPSLFPPLWPTLPVNVVTP